MINETIAHYRITGKLGQGGMGEVYRATDTKLDREVAIKILPESFAEDKNRVTRFNREAKALAALNHPNIAVIHGIEQSDNVHALIMELIEGETLGERLARKRMTVTEALECCKHIAAALEAAHEKGIIHRDLKPDNIKLTPDGQVKVLDFGIAKALVDRSKGDVTTVTATVTKPGALLGTPAYMSPEQARGEEVDQRTDIWSFGAVLFECLTGKCLFAGKTAGETMAAVFSQNPDWNLLPPDVPPLIRLVLQKCLDRDPRQRLRNIGDLQLLLESAVLEEPHRADVPGRLVRKDLIWFVAAAVFAIAFLIVLIIHFGKEAPIEPVVDSKIPFPAGTDGPGLFFQHQLSPDGQYVAVSGVRTSAELGEGGLYLRRTDKPGWKPLSGTGATTSGGKFFWSPDSRSIAFFDRTDSKLKRVDVAGGVGGPVQEITEIRLGDFGAWGRDTIVFSRVKRGPLFTVPADGSGEPKALTTPETGSVHLYPSFLPDGRHLLYTVRGGSDPGIYITSVDDPGKADRRLLPDESSAIFAPATRSKVDGYLIFIRDGKLMAQPFDPDALKLRGDAVILAERALRNDGGTVAVSAAENGILMYLDGWNRETDSRLGLYDRNGKLQSAEGPMGAPSSVSLSPNGRMVAVVRGTPETGNYNIWLRNLESDREDPFTVDGAVDRLANAVWSPTGDRIAYSTFTDGVSEIYIKDVPAAGPARLIERGKNRRVITDWSDDGYLVYTEFDPVRKSDLWVRQLKDDETLNPEPVMVLTNMFNTSFGQISPDGRWIAYVSDRTGEWQVYVRQFPTGPLRFQISRSGINQAPRWNGDGSELYFDGGSTGIPTVMVARARTPSAPGDSSFSDPEPLFDIRLNGFSPRQGKYFYDVSSTGDRFLINVVGGTTEPFLHVLVNWEQVLHGGR